MILETLLEKQGIVRVRGCRGNRKKSIPFGLARVFKRAIGVGIVEEPFTLSSFQHGSHALGVGKEQERKEGMKRARKIS